MSAGIGLAQRWEITAHPSGEVCATQEHEPGLDLWLLGVRTERTESELRGWLHDVAGVALEASHATRRDAAIPPLLHHALTGLLFSHAELWEKPGEIPPCSVVFAAAEDEIGFGWVGEAQVELLVDGIAAPTRWVVVRDSTGREGRAFRIPHGHELAMRLSWVADALDPASPMIVLEAHWPGGSDTGSHVSPADSEHAALEAPIVTMPALETPAFETPPAAIDDDAAAESSTLEHVLATDAASPPTETVTPATAEFAPTNREAAPADASSPGAVASADATAARGPLASTLDPARPSTGIARWLQRNFSWLGGGHPGAATRPEPPVADPSMGTPAIVAAATQEPLALDAPHALAGPTALDATVEDLAGEAPQSAPTDIATPTETEPLALLRSHEDQVAASAAALAAAISGVEPVVRDDEAPWRDTRGGDPGRVLETLPERVPPTPEPASLTARTVPLPAPEPPGRIPRSVEAPLASSPLATPPAVPPRPGAREAAPVSPPRLEVTPRPMLRRPGDPVPPGPGHEIHHRALDAATPAPPSGPLMIERVGNEPAPLAVTPLGVARPAPVGPSPEESPPQSSPAPTTNTPDASEWVSRFKRPEPLFDTPGYDEAPAPADEAELLAAARRDEWTDLHATATRMPASATPAMPVDAPHAAEGRASESVTPAVRRVPPQHPAWPEAGELEATRSFDRRWGWAAVVVAILFGVGWLLGAVQTPGSHTGDENRKGALAALLAGLGYQGPHYQVSVASRPDGAWIRLDGRDLQRRTPADLELTPGHHVVALSFGQWGGTEYPLDGRKGDQLKVDGTLWGALDVASPDPGAVIAVSVDERPRGFAPLKIDSLAPGPHQVRFSGPGMASWGQTVEVRVGEQRQVLTRALSSPSTGILQIRATATIDGEPGEVKGAKVFLDGKPHGLTPQSIELPRGPHSVRLDYHGESSVVQVIDLPGGNQRYANFELGTGVEPPHFKLDAPAHFPPAEPVVVSATFDGVPAADVKEMWLHVRDADGTWERYPMSRLDAQLSAAGSVGALTFPSAAFDATGRSQWYVSVTSAQGDEYFTELQDAFLDRPKR